MPVPQRIGLGTVRDANQKTEVQRTRTTTMDQAMQSVVRAVEAGATTIKGVIDATGLSRLKIERALIALEKQKLLVRDGQGFRATGLPKTTRPIRQCGSCNACCDVLEVAAVD